MPRRGRSACIDRSAPAHRRIAARHGRRGDGRTGAAGRRAGVYRPARIGLHAPGLARAGLRRGAGRGLRLPLGRRRPARPARSGAPPGQPEAGRTLRRRAGGAGRRGACHQQCADRRARPGDRPGAQRPGALGEPAAHQCHRAVSRPTGLCRPVVRTGQTSRAEGAPGQSAVGLEHRALAAGGRQGRGAAPGFRHRHAGGARRERVRARTHRRPSPQARRAGAAVVAAGARALEADRRVQHEEPTADDLALQRVHASRWADVLRPGRARLLPARRRLRRQGAEGCTRRRSAAEHAEPVPAGAQPARRSGPGADTAADACWRRPAS